MQGTVLIFGTFDIVHAGHLRFFRDAKRLGKTLVAVVGRDARVKKIKGYEAIHTEKERLNMLRHIDYIDTALLGDRHDVYKVIRNIRPDIIALGYDQKAFVAGIRQQLHAHGISARVVRLHAYCPKRCKTTYIRKRLAYA